MEPNNIKKVAHVWCKKSLLNFTRYMFKEMHKTNYIVRYHHTVIADALEKVIRGEITRLTISISPRLGKTEVGVVQFIAHCLALNPSAKFIHLSSTDSLARTNSEFCKDVVKSDAYRALYPYVEIKPGSDSKQKWYTTDGGGVYATGAAGQVTGFGAGKTDSADLEQTTEELIDEFFDWLDAKEEFAGGIVYDDPMKPDEALSDTKRKAVNEKYVSTIMNRVNSRRTPIIIIAQRIHKEDLIGYVNKMEPGRWTNIVLPELYTDATGVLQCLDPSKRTIADLQRMQNHEDSHWRYIFETQHQQNPQTKEGLMFPLDKLKMYNPADVDVLKDSEFSFAYIDPADKGGDDLAGVYCHLIGKNIYVHDIVYNKDGADYNQHLCLEKIKANKTQECIVEGNSGWVMFGYNLRVIINDLNINCDLRIHKSTTNKQTRIYAGHTFVKNNFYFRKDWQAETQYRRYIENLTEYLINQDGGGNKHDDAPDATVGAGGYFDRTFGHLWTRQG